MTVFYLFALKRGMFRIISFLIRKRDCKRNDFGSMFGLIRSEVCASVEVMI